MTDEEKCDAGIYDTVDVVVIRLREVLNDCKIDKKAKLLLEDIIENNWSHHDEMVEKEKHEKIHNRSQPRVDSAAVDDWPGIKNHEQWMG